jgi:hypothetical protein
MQLKPGARLRSTVCTTEVIIVRAPKEDVEISCGGQPMVPLGTDVPEGGSVSADFAGGTQLGKRYADEETGIELLATKAGEGSLALNGQPLLLKEAKPLPSSD